MPRYLWHLDADGWPLERIDTRTGEHVPVITGEPHESLHPQGRGRPIACCYPRAEGGCKCWRLPDPGSGESG
jgi:hypothetical protein